MRNRIGMAAVLCGLALTLGCNSLPERIETLEEARALVNELEQEPLTQEVAATRFDAAQEALERAERNYEEGEDLELIEHDAYVALRNAQIAQQQIEEQRARDELLAGEAERNRVLLQAREQEAQQSEQLAQQRGTALRQQEQEAQQSEQLAQQRGTALRQQEQETQQAEQRVQQLEQQREQLAEETEALQQELTELEAEQTDRGIVLTLQDVLFDVEGAELKPGAESTLQRIAVFLNEHPDRKLLIEGHTDASGTAGYNRELSEERAEAVRDALGDRGIDETRIEIRGLGEAYPVASNDTTTGRQLNRRVEVVISAQGGEFEEGAVRTASLDEQEEDDSE